MKVNLAIKQIGNNIEANRNDLDELTEIVDRQGVETARQVAQLNERVARIEELNNPALIASTGVVTMTALCVVAETVPLVAPVAMPLAGAVIVCATGYVVYKGTKAAISATTQYFWPAKPK